MNIKDLKGKRFHKLTILRRAEKRNTDEKPRWVCLCDCGAEVTKESRWLLKNRYACCPDCKVRALARLNRSNGLKRVFKKKIEKVILTKSFFRDRIKDCEEMIGSNNYYLCIFGIGLTMETNNKILKYLEAN